MPSQPIHQNQHSSQEPNSTQTQEQATGTGTFTIHYFASASTYTQKPTEHLPAPMPLSNLFPALESRYPGIGQKVLGSCGVSLDGEYVDVGVDLNAVSEGKTPDAGNTRVIGVGAEVAIIPPVSSG